MTSPKALQDTLDEVRASGVVSPDFKTPLPRTWEQLCLDGRLMRLRVFLALYFVLLAWFWGYVAGPLLWSPRGVLLVFAAALFNFGFLISSAYKVQRVLHEAGLQRHGAWQVWVGALLLNPVILGWYIPVSVLFGALRIKRKMLAQTAPS